MKSKPLILFLLFLSIVINLKAQDEMVTYRKLFKYADSVSKTKQKIILDKGCYINLSILDNKHPTEFFNEAGNLIKDSRFNSASFIYYVGYFRYRYYNLANPGYQPDGDGAIFNSLESVFGELINLYMRTNIDNYIIVLEKTKEWISTYDYNFFSKNKNPAKYQEQIS